MKKGYLTPGAVIILGLICFFVGIGLLLNSQLFKKSPTESTPSASTQSSPSPKASSADTSNWKTYTNTKYGYSLKYPNDWHNDCTPPICDGVSVGIVKNGQRNLEAVSSISIVIAQNPGNLSLDEWIKNDTNKKNTILGIDAGKPTLTSINGYRVYKLIGINERNNEDIVFFLENNKTIYEIYLALVPQFHDETKTAFNQILSTFKFTN